MTFRHFQSVFRPLVDRAWSAQCRISGVPPNNSTARDRWYREQIRAATDGRIHSTRGISPDNMRLLLNRFTMLSQGGDTAHISGWSDGQNAWFAQLVMDAWQMVNRRGERGAFATWIDAILGDAGFTAQRVAPDRKTSFDAVMGHLAVLAGDMRAIAHFSEADERRLRWQIEQFLRDLDYLTKTSHNWGYVLGIWSQARQLPDRIEEAPAELLWKVLQMLDTHIRRLCKDYIIRPCELPSRAHPHQAPVPKPTITFTSATS